jgi:hypothetical protein
MLVLAGARSLKSGNTAYITCDGYYTGVFAFPDQKAENIPTAILAMYMQPTVVHPRVLGKCKLIRLIDVDCREMLIFLAHSTNIVITKENKLKIAAGFVSSLPYFEKEVIDLSVTPFESVYRRFNLQNCLAAEENPY